MLRYYYVSKKRYGKFKNAARYCKQEKRNKIFVIKNRIDGFVIEVKPCISEIFLAYIKKILFYFLQYNIYSKFEPVFVHYENAI